MDAGRQLDARIAQEVLGGGLKGEPYTQLPEFSADIAAAWLVVEALHRRGLCVSVSVLQGWDTQYECAIYRECILDPIASGDANTMPLAICRAALAIQE